MRYLSFHIQNFRGVKDAKVDLVPGGANVFTFIGLNESGKTTVLEAMASFQVRANDETSLYQSNPVQADPSSYVPKHEKATFTGDITVSAIVEFEKNEKATCIEFTEKQSSVVIDPDTLPDRFRITRGYRFANGDFVKRLDVWDIAVQGRGKGKRKYSAIQPGDNAWKYFSSMVSIHLPEIVYFPTFLFEQPDKVILNPETKERPADRAYRKVIENIGGSLTRPINIKTNIVDRIVEPENEGDTFLGLFSLSNNRQQQIESAISQMSHHLSETVLTRWSRIFGGSTSNREVRLKLGVDAHPSGEPRVYVQFSLRDGTQPYDISERSLGFRWFFSFLLFTLYRDVGSTYKKTVFLLDEPASNLHAGAQIQLLESFPNIATNGSVIVYSTHSHYMINPDWLDQAHIVSNDGVDYDDMHNSVMGGSRHSHVTVQRYRTFVGRNPDKTTYFQPVLDRLQVVPSKLDSLQPAAIVEGKGDYLILSFGLWMLGSSAEDYAIIPTRGADHFDDLIGILLGWGVNFVLCCDDDKPGRKAAKEYLDQWGIPKSRVFTLAEASADLTDGSIEDLLDDDDIDLIRVHFSCSSRPSKSQIQLFFSEHLAAKKRPNLSETFLERIEALDRLIRKGLQIGPRS